MQYDPLTNDGPYTILDLTKEQHDDLMEIVDRNITVSLGVLGRIEDMDIARKLVDQIERFKNLRYQMVSQHD